MKQQEYLAQLPRWLRRLTLLVFYPAAAVLGFMVAGNMVFDHLWLTGVLGVALVVVVGIHTARAFWQLGRTRS